MQKIAQRFRKIKILPFGSCQSCGYDIRQLLLFWFEKMIRVQVAPGPPVAATWHIQASRRSGYQKKPWLLLSYV